MKNKKSKLYFFHICVRGAGLMSVYVGTQTFEKHVIWGYALIGLFQIVLGAQAPPTFVVRANQYCFDMFGLVWLDRSQRLSFHSAAARQLTDRN